MKSLYATALKAAALWAVFSCLIANPVAAQDDTFQCLETFAGSVTAVEDSAYGETRWTLITEPERRFDARGAVILQQTDPPPPGASINDYPLDLRTDGLNPVCWAGGVIHNTNDLDITWGESKKPNNAAIIAQEGNFTFDGLRIHNAHDAIRPARRQEGKSQFTVRNSWLTYIRDDRIENDHMAGGEVEDNLFDGCYAFISSRNPNIDKDRGNTVTVRNNLVRLQIMPGVYNFPSKDGHGALFKWQDNGPDLVIEDNVFLIEDCASSGSRASDCGKSDTLLGFRQAQGQLAGCKNNVIVWLGEGPFPGDVPSDCATVTTDRTVWDQARAEWIRCHPQVVRIAGVDVEPAGSCGDDPGSGGGGEDTTNEELLAEIERLKGLHATASDEISRLNAIMFQKANELIEGRTKP